MHALLQAAPADGAAERATHLRQVAESLHGGLELAEEMADKAEAVAARFERR